MEITQVKCLKDGTTVKYTEVNVNTPEHTELPQCPDRRDADFESALGSVRSLGARLLGQKRAEWECQGVSVSKNPLGHRAFTIHGMLKTPVGLTNCAVPLMREMVDGEGGQNTFSSSQLETVDTLLARAVDYVRGEREQMDLPLDGTREGEDDEEAKVTETEAAGVS